MQEMPVSQKENKKSVLDILAKIVRVITIPPFMVAALLTILYFCADVFPTVGDYWLSLLFLAVLPVLAYPVSMLVPRWRAGGRRVQRNLAFVFSFVGYTGAVVTSILRGAIPNLLYISAVYLLSVLILTLFNCLSPWHASGHGCSLMGPIVLICLFVGWILVPAGVVLFAASLWASVHMKRHTLREFLLGAASSVIAAFACYFLIHPVF